MRRTTRKRKEEKDRVRKNGATENKERSKAVCSNSPVACQPLVVKAEGSK